MGGPSTITIRRYYASFKSLSGVLASIFGALPFLSQFLPGNPYTFPPMGDIEPAARVGLVILAFAMTFGAYFWASALHRHTRTVMGVAIAASFIFLLCYLGLYERFVIRVDIPSRETVVWVSVGYQRTAFADATFGPVSDWDLVRSRGTDEEQLRKLWTTKSLIVARLLLYGAYSLFILALVGVFSFGVVRDIYERTEPGAAEEPESVKASG